MEQDSEKDEPVPTGDTRIIIEGEGMLETSTRSSDGRVDFTGGYATGAGLYNGNSAPTVAAYPDKGYEVNYFYGGPSSEPKRYDYSQSGESEFKVPLGGQNHTFHCGFKEKKRTLTINAGEGGTTAPEGTREYQVEKSITIMATQSIKEERHHDQQHDNNNGYHHAGLDVDTGRSCHARSL